MCMINNILYIPEKKCRINVKQCCKKLKNKQERSEVSCKHKYHIQEQ